jgi:hypothetical protein
MGRLSFELGLRPTLKPIYLFSGVEYSIISSKREVVMFSNAKDSCEHKSRQKVCRI